MKKSFSEMGISAPILKAVEEMGFDTPTEVQGRGIPHILNNEDLIVISKTGSGKTAVFGVSMLQMIDPAAEGPQGLVLAPTRELAVQVDSDMSRMAKYTGHKMTAVYGQHNINTEIKAISEGVSIIAGTPGRVYDHIHHGNLKTKNIRFLILDEADRMLDMGFLDQVVKIIRTLPKDRITLLFSATMPPEVLQICKKYMKQPVTIAIESPTKTVDTIEQAYYRVERNRKNTELSRILNVEQPDSCIIFCNMKSAVDRVYGFLSKRGYSCQPLHGDIPQSKRMSTIEQFKRGDFHILVATDVAARGIHVDELSLVINYDVPVEKDSYVHRIGRTGRIGNTGKALTLVSEDDIMSLYDIEEHIGVMINEGDLPSDSVLNECKASADEWMKSRRMKEPPVKDQERQPARGKRKAAKDDLAETADKTKEIEETSEAISGEKAKRKRRRKKPSAKKSETAEISVEKAPQDGGKADTIRKDKRKEHRDRAVPERTAADHDRAIREKSLAALAQYEKQKRTHGRPYGKEYQGSLVGRLLKRLLGK